MICWLSDTLLLKESTIKSIISESKPTNSKTSLDSLKQEVKVFLHNWSKQFVIMFKNGEIIGETKYMTGIEGMPNIPSAYIPIQYHDPNSKLIKDSVLLIKRKEKWYLVGI
jgi:hypothetical protein